MSSGPPETAAGSSIARARSRDDIQSWIATAVAQLLKVEVDAVDLNGQFKSFGIDSLAAFSMTGQLSEWLQRDLSATLLWEYPTIASLADYLARLAAEPSSAVGGQHRSIRLAGDHGAAKLFALCGIEIYQALANRIADAVSTYGVYIPPNKTVVRAGASLDERYGFDSVEDLAAQYVKEITEVDPHGPYGLLGLSFGGILAFEAAHQLRRAGRRVAFVMLLDSVLVTAIKKRAYRHAIDWLKSVRALARRTEASAPAGSPTREQLERDHGRYYWTLSKRYAPPPFAGHVILVRAAQANLFGRGYMQDVHMGWRELVAGDLDTVTLDCSHTGMLQSPHVELLAEVLRPASRSSAQNPPA